MSAERKLTENERAARFIGWSVVPSKDENRPNVPPIFCPDMSDPRNYMKAVINLAKQGAQPSLEWMDYSDADPIEKLQPPFKYWAFSIRVNNAAGKGMHTDIDSPAGAIIKALAALWDAEHSK